MGTNPNRARRKLKKQEGRQRRFANKLKHYRSLIAPREVLDELIREARQAHGSLLDVIEIDADEVLTGQVLVDRHGYGRFRVHRFESQENDKHIDRAREPWDGGHISVLHCDEEGYRTIIFLRRRKIDSTDADLSDYINQALFLHEVGHVDDFERGVNLVPGKPMSSVATELYAHHFACREMARRHLKTALAYYLADCIKQLCESHVDPREMPRGAFTESREYLRHTAFVGDLFTNWGKA